MNRSAAAVMVIILSLITPAGRAEEPYRGILAEELLMTHEVSEVMEYRCEQPGQCTVRCMAGAGQLGLERQDVRRLEMARTGSSLLLGIYYLSPSGENQRTEANLPTPASCVLDNLVVDALSRIVDGKVISTGAREEVIFDFEPLRN
ncbi:MAG: hypothetical protein KDI36_08795 [Pseudomonadales bacterium]|nr:hypothetical protein [Pseudomonadales bacterium]